MAIDLVDLYGDRATLPTSGYPLGSVKDRVSATDRGTPLQNILYNDLLGPLHSLLVLAGMTPSGSPDFVGNSQYLRALIEQIVGRAAMCTASGNSSNIDLSPTGSQEPPESLFDGMTLMFRNEAGADSGTTINAFGLGARSVTLSNGSPIAASNIQGLVTIVYSASSDRWEVPVLDANRIVNAISRDVLPGPSSILAGIVRQATTTEINNRSNVTAFVAPDQLPRQATNTEVANGSNVTAFVAPDQLPTPQTINFFESSALTFSNASVVNIAHGLGARPRQCQAFFRCIVAEQGFSVDEEVKINTAYFNDGEEVGVQVSADSANLYATISHYGNPTIYSKSSPGQSFGATSANWRLVLKALL